MKAFPAVGDALVVVDVQNDFLPGGALAVPASDEIIPVLNRYIALFRIRELSIVITRDWHPPDHCSFKSYGGPWPPHCVQGTQGAAFPSSLYFPCEAHILSKGAAMEKDAYSAFMDTGLNHLLQSIDTRRVLVGGLATEYCVFNTVKDALGYGYITFVLQDAVRAINRSADDGRHALEEMTRLGAILIDIAATSI